MGVGTVGGDRGGDSGDRDVDNDEDYEDGEHYILDQDLVRCNVIQDLGVIISVVAMLTFVFTLAVLISLLSNLFLVLFSKNYVNICSQYSHVPPHVVLGILIL